MSLASLPVVAKPPGAAAPVDVGGLRAALAERVAGEVRFERLDRALYSTDASVYQIVPLGVVLPKTEADVRAVLEVCTEFGVPLTARGGGTSQAGQCIGAGVILDFSKHYNSMLEINVAERWARVQPGCVLDELNQQLKAHGLQFAPDISTANRATIGGMIANNSSGTHSLIHGKTVDHVLELKVLLADGSVAHLRPLEADDLAAKCAQADLEGKCYILIRDLAARHAEEIDRRFPKILRRVGGYNLDLFVPGRAGGNAPPLTKGGQGGVQDRDKPLAPSNPPCPPFVRGGELEAFNLAHLLVGSEGTLAIVLEAKLRLVALPRAKAMLVVQFSDLLDALAATPAILAHQPAAVEVMDKYILDSTKLNAEALRLRDFVHDDPAAILIIEFYGDTSEELPGRLDILEADLRRRGCGFHFHRAVEPAAQACIWKLRTLALGLSMAEKGDAKAISFVEDTAVAPEHLRDYIEEFLGVVARHGTRAGVYAHASVGCLHVRPIVNLKTERGVQQFSAIADEVAELVLKYGGALSGEHGDGLVRSPFQEKMFGPVLYQAFRAIKQAFDPRGLFNPGKIVDATPLTANLRLGPAYVTPDVPTTFDFTADGGLTRAAELCAGVGECRKRRGGAMCPSYRATGDELHSTRGRANALRLALTGQLALAGLTDPHLKEAFDLCLECKACKSECPTNVDMARLKAEFLDQYFKKHGVPWRNRLFGNVATLGLWGSRFRPVSNWLARSRLTRWLNEKCFGIDRRRVPPRFARRFEPRPVPTAAPPQVLFFVDTFVRFHEPELGQAALELLDRLHITPQFDDRLGCCGRPMISNGMLDQAIVNAEHNVACLYPWAAQGKPIIACEPSCILTMKDDYPALLQGEARRQAQVVAGMCQTLEEFLDATLTRRAGGVSPLKTPPTQGANAPRSACRKILVQAHCHQRSLVGVEPMLRLLRRIPDVAVVDLDAGCCGMAGSFGYETEHYEISRLVGEQQLFPLLRAADPQATVVAPGFSCRLQIEHFTGLTATHPAQLLRDLVVRA